MVGVSLSYRCTGAHTLPLCSFIGNTHWFEGKKLVVPWSSTGHETRLARPGWEPILRGQDFLTEGAWVPEKSMNTLNFQAKI